MKARAHLCAAAMLLLLIGLLAGLAHAGSAARGPQSSRASAAHPGLQFGAGPYYLRLLVSAPASCTSCAIYVDLDSDPAPSECEHVFDVPDTGGVEQDLAVTLRGEANPHIYWLAAGDHSFSLRGTSEEVAYSSGYAAPYCGTAADFARVKASFGTRSGDPEYNARADLNNDGLITIQDFLMVRLFFGLC